MVMNFTDISILFIFPLSFMRMCDLALIMKALIVSCNFSECFYSLFFYQLLLCLPFDSSLCLE